MARGNFKLVGADQLRKALKRLSTDTMLDIDAYLNAKAKDIERDAINRAPVNDGFLKAGIHANTDTFLSKTITSNEDYSGYVEFGTRSRVSIPPGLQKVAAQIKGPTGKTKEQAKEAIYEWCRKKGIPKERWWFIFISVMVHGSKPHPFFFPAYFQNVRPRKVETDIRKIIQKG